MLATQNTVDLLNSLLRGELSATETYDQAIEKFAGEPAMATLRQIRDEHRTLANAIREHIHQFGGEPEQSSGAWGTFAKAVTGTAKLMGQTAALKALKEGEEQGLKDYQSAVQQEELPRECQSIIRAECIPQGQEHIRALDRLMAK